MYLRTYMVLKTEVFIMNNSNYEACMSRYQVDEYYMSILLQCVLNKQGLYSASNTLLEETGVLLPLEKLYTLATSLCCSILGEEINEIAPKMCEDRKKLGVVANIDKHKDNSNKQVFDDLVEELEVLFLEYDDVG